MNNDQVAITQILNFKECGVTPSIERDQDGDYKIKFRHKRVSVEIKLQDYQFRDLKELINDIDMKGF